MSRKIAIILTFIFTLFIVSPTVISVVEKNFDISILYNLNEEENNQNESSKTFDLEFSESKTSSSAFNSLSKEKVFIYNSKKYASISKENSSPPPEFL